MLRRIFERQLLRPEDVPPSRPDWEVIGVFNPAAVRVNNEVILLVRVVERPRERRPGFHALPRWRPGAGPTIDWEPECDLHLADPRVARRRRDWSARLRFISHFLVVRCGDGRSVAEVSTARFFPQEFWEEYGVEDPRLTFFQGRYYFTYVAVSRHGVATALASTLDFQTFDRHGIIFCPENKDVVLFPERVDGEVVAIHRPSGGAGFARPEMWLARSPDLIHWGRHKPLYRGCADWECVRVGAGPPPVLISEGWLFVYHGQGPAAHLGGFGEYASGALLLDRHDPSRILQRTQTPLFRPEQEHERNGFVPNVVFPTGLVENDDNLLVYYGAADTSTAVVEVARAELLAALR